MPIVTIYKIKHFQRVSETDIAPVLDNGAILGEGYISGDFIDLNTGEVYVAASDIHGEIMGFMPMGIFR